MAKRKPKPKKLFTFPFHGMTVTVFLAHQSCEWLQNPETPKKPYLGIVYYDAGEIYINDKLSESGRRMVCAHEYEHLVEEENGIDHMHAAPDASASDERTNLISKGWHYALTHCPDLIAYLQHED